MFNNARIQGGLRRLKELINNDGCGILATAIHNNIL